MNAVQTATASPAPGEPVAARVPMLTALRVLLLTEAAMTLGLAIFLSMLAAGLRDSLGGEAGVTAEQNVRFAAAGAFGFTIFAAVASRGARRRRSWAWTMAAVLQLIMAVGTGAAILVAEWHPAYLVGFAFATVVMLVLSTASVRRALGQH